MTRQRQWQRPKDLRQASRADARGIVGIMIQLRAKGSAGWVKGNLSRTISVAEATVSEIADAIEEALFGNNHKPRGRPPKGV